jgi:hypothetical protein
MNTNTTIKASLDDFSPSNQTEKLYLIDFSKITNVNELVMCIASVGLTISSKNPMFNEVRQFLLLDQPFEIPSEEPKEKKINLPKLKQI